MRRWSLQKASTKRREMARLDAWDKETLGSTEEHTRCARDGIRRVVGVIGSPIGGHMWRTKEEQSDWRRCSRGLLQLTGEVDWMELVVRNNMMNTMDREATMFRVARVGMLEVEDKVGRG